MKDITINISFGDLNISAYEIGEYIGENYCGDDFADLINGMGRSFKENGDLEWAYRAFTDERNRLDSDGEWLIEKIKEFGKGEYVD